jgi:hypothetical protein
MLLNIIQVFKLENGVNIKEINFQRKNSSLKLIKFLKTMVDMQDL